MPCMHTGRSGKSNSGPGSKRSQDTHQPLEPPDLGDVFDGIDTVTTDRQRRERSQINNSQPADPWQPPIFDRPDSDSLLPDIDPDIEDFLEEEEDEEGVDDGQADRRWNPQGWEERYADAEYYEELERGLADGTYVEIVSMCWEAVRHRGLHRSESRKGSRSKKVERKGDRSNHALPTILHAPCTVSKEPGEVNDEWLSCDYMFDACNRHCCPASSWMH